MTPVELFPGPDLLVNHEYSPYEVPAFKKIPIQAIQTKVFNLDRPVYILPYVLFTIYDEGFAVSLN